MTTHSDPLCRREFLARATQTTVAIAASAGMGASLAPRFAGAGEASPPRASRISYFCNGEIMSTRWASPNESRVTPGHLGFQAVLVQDRRQLVCFRRFEDDPGRAQVEGARSSSSTRTAADFTR